MTDFKDVESRLYYENKVLTNLSQSQAARIEGQDRELDAQAEQISLLQKEVYQLRRAIEIILEKDETKEDPLPRRLSS